MMSPNSVFYGPSGWFRRSLGEWGEAVDLQRSDGRFFPLLFESISYLCQSLGNGCVYSQFRRI